MSRVAVVVVVMVVEGEGRNIIQVSDNVFLKPNTF